MSRPVHFISLALITLLACLSGEAFAAPVTQAVRYRGLNITVPAGWPVINLASDPSACVRFNRHALYLGRPGANQACPPHAAGRTEAILVEPMLAGAADGTTGLALREATTAAAGSGVTHFLVRARGVMVTATWRNDASLVARALGLRSLPRSEPTALGAAAATGPVAHTASAALPGQVFTGRGFDPCSTPSLATMSAWRVSPYHAVGVYIGGVNEACSQPNLTTAWVNAESAAGWHLIPTYVGLQAPSNSCGCGAMSSTPSKAYSEGQAAAADAMSQAAAVGIGRGNPIYDDMEAYGRGGSNTTAVLSFLSGWTAALHARHYLSGVYSSGASGIADLVSRWGTTYLEPDELWIADWNNARTTSDPYVPAADWANHQRLHQYDGGADVTYGGVTLNIDGDYLDGATAAGGSGSGSIPSFPDSTFLELAGTYKTYRVAGGAPLYVSDWAAVGGQQAVTAVTQQQLNALNPVPRNGTFLTTSTGEIYRVAGGAPLWVSSWSVFGGTQPSVAVDEWDLDNIANPAAHLRPVPANGTFLTTPQGLVYRVAGGAPLLVSSWSIFGGAQPSVTVDPWDIANAGNPSSHLNSVPVNGTVVEGLPSHSYYVFVSGPFIGTSLRPVNPTSSATAVDDASLSSFPRLPVCVVPSLRHRTLSQARRALHHARCTVGKVHRPAHWPRHHVLRVVRQSSSATSIHPAQYAVSLNLA